ncbi:MAG: restriction endonuclease subunit S, partial [Enterovibrio sp.]
VYLTKIAGEAVGDFHVMRPISNSYGTFLKSLMLTTDYISTVDASTFGAKMPRASWEFTSNIQLPFCSEMEAEKIAAFLDHETAKIDTLIAKQEKLIELLKEKRQAVISHAVTKGLNPDAPMKDSGVEWLGQVPAHWVVSKLSLYTHKIGSGKTPKGGADVYQESGVLFLRSQNVYDDGLRISGSEATYISDLIHSEMANTSVKPFDVLLNITGGSIGRTCIVPPTFVEANVNQHVCILRFSKKTAPYFANVMKSSSIKEQIDVVQVGGNREGLNFEQIANMKVCIPPKDEMNQINEFIQSQLCKFEELVQKAANAISLMKERRTALISAAVTGKIDVRDWTN